MPRRKFLIWFGRAVYTACTALVLAPVASYLAGPAQRTVTNGAVRRRLTRLDALPIGEPVLLPVVGARADAWTLHPGQVIGRVWATRLSRAEVAPEHTNVRLFNAACPHSGCPVSKADKGFICHCHGAKFERDGDRVPDAPGYVNASPRGLDPLEHAVVKDTATGDWWVEVNYKDFVAGVSDRLERT